MLISEIRLIATTYANKYHALNNEYALISDMRLIMRKYGIDSSQRARKLALVVDITSVRHVKPEQNSVEYTPYSK